MRLRPLLAATAVIALSLALASCAPAEESDDIRVSPSASASSTDVGSQTDADDGDEPAATPTEASCETILSSSMLASFAEVGWTYRQQDFSLGSETLDEGFECIWGDYSVATDQVQVYGWAPLSAADSAAAQQRLLDEGWLQADADGNTYITENPETAMETDENGFGTTYQFGDGWVTIADRKDGLILISVPES